jgi:hypothetical protein
LNALLSEVIEAHGGTVRWKSFDNVSATIVCEGALWGMKSLDWNLDPRQLTVWLRQQRSTLVPFGDPAWSGEFTPDRVAILNNDGSVVADRDRPRESFAGHGRRSAWDPLHLVYFEGYALWAALNTPFQLAMPGVEVSEVEISEVQSWIDHGETWRILRARFSDAIATHATVQDFFFGEDLLLRRHDYRIDVAGGLEVTHLVFDHIQFDGIILPTRHRAYVRGPDHRFESVPLLMSVDLGNIRFS